MLPSSDAQAVGRLLAERFGLPRWQLAATASDANRFAIRIARAVTGRGRLVVFDGCYHGAVDDTLVSIEISRPEPVVPAERPVAESGVPAHGSEEGEAE